VIEGEVLAGKYRVECVLGEGGMGVVVAAHHIGLDERVAIKFLRPEMLENAEAVDRFAREARAAVKIKGEHVARVFDVGTLETGAPYMVMEFLQGEDLSGWIRQRGPLGIEDAVAFVLQACEAIAEAHALGIVHRDLKPSNLFCIRGADGRPTIKVLDFGISKVASTTAGARGPATQTNTVLGTTLYMSPEQIHSAKDVDARTDIWALGVVLFELMTGRVPFEGETHVQVAVKVSVEAPPPLRRDRPDAPPGLEEVILRCLEKRREQRYSNVAELALALLPFSPKLSKVSVERITGIIQSAGMSATALSVPSYPGLARGTETLAQASMGRSVARAVVDGPGEALTRSDPGRLWAWIAVGVLGTSIVGVTLFAATRYVAQWTVSTTPSGSTTRVAAPPLQEVIQLSPLGDSQPMPISTPIQSTAEVAPEVSAVLAGSERVVAHSALGRIDSGHWITPPKSIIAGVASTRMEPPPIPKPSGSVAAGTPPTAAAMTTTTPTTARPAKAPAVVDPLYMPIQ
jgi:serine/threonine-protein kinase